MLYYVYYKWQQLTVAKFKMGTKRPTKTTKSGRYMNPTDQARKEARRKELKKNKKQRMAVRQAVLKGKDPLLLVIITI